MGVAGRRRIAMRLPCNTFYNFMLFTNYVCIYVFMLLLQNKYHYHYHWTCLHYGISKSRMFMMQQNGPRSLSNFTIGTFNVRGLSSATKHDQLSKLHIDVCSIQETKCPSGFDVISSYRPSIHVTALRPRVCCGFLPGRLLRYWSVSRRLAVTRLSLGSHSTLTIINAYGPTSQVTLRNQDTQDDLYAALDSITTRYSSSALILIAGDFNNKLENKLTNELSTGEHPCGIRNTNGTVLAGFLETHSLFACNTAFQHATRPRGKVNTAMR